LFLYKQIEKMIIFGLRSIESEPNSYRSKTICQMNFKLCIRHYVV
jgi:hypothetical protein